MLQIDIATALRERAEASALLLAALAVNAVAIVSQSEKSAGKTDVQQIGEGV